MIKVEFLGGARKSFPTGSMLLDCASSTISDMLQILTESKPAGTPDLDTHNILVAVNGADSSALGGRSAILRDGDKVTIIPVIHGGQDVQFSIHEISIIAIHVRKIDLDLLRQNFPDINIQAVSPRFVLGASHLRRILEIAVESNRRGVMLAKHIETDILLRLAGTTQIVRAIHDAGVSPGQSAVVIALGALIKLVQMTEMLAVNTLPFPQGNDTFLKEQVGAEALNTGCTLEDILAERASVLGY